MIKADLLKLEHLVIAEEKPNYFVHLHTEEGYYLTDWNKEDIKQFHASVCYYMPIKDEYNEFYIITKEEYDNYSKEQREVIEKEMEDMKNKNR